MKKTIVYVYYKGKAKDYLYFDSLKLAQLYMSKVLQPDLNCEAYGLERN